MAKVALHAALEVRYSALAGQQVEHMIHRHGLTAFLFFELHRDDQIITGAAIALRRLVVAHVDEAAGILAGFKFNFLGLERHDFNHVAVVDDVCIHTLCELFYYWLFALACGAELFVVPLGWFFAP